MQNENGSISNLDIKIVYGILKFAKSQKHPLQCSAFTFSETYIPSRLDFAKERFGGPFTTERVENVKTFSWGQLLLILFALGPVFVLEVATSFLSYFSIIKFWCAFTPPV